jgi:hypothetical protein
MAVGGVRIEWLGEQFAANTRAALALLGVHVSSEETA